MPWVYDSRSFFTVTCSQYGINSHFSESFFMAKSLLETCTSLDMAGVCLWKSFLSISLAQVLAIWFINQSDESVISIYNHFWWWIVYSKLVKYLWKDENRLKWHFIFSRVIHFNLKDFFGQIVSTLKGLQCIFDIHPYLDSNWNGYSFKLKFLF